MRRILLRSFESHEYEINNVIYIREWWVDAVIGRTKVGEKILLSKFSDNSISLQSCYSLSGFYYRGTIADVSW